MGNGVVPDISEPLQTTLDIVIGFGTDFFAFIVVAALVAAFAFYFGGDHLVSFVAGIFAAIPLYSFFPYRDLLPDNPYVSIGIFVAFVALSMVAFSGLSAFVESASTSFMKILGLSAIAAGLLLAVAIHNLPIEEIYTFSEPTKALFASDFSYFWWLLAAPTGLFFLGRA